ncbi:MAG: sigma-70 family RNA polymerase sigma factor [FCB group bacterium]|nr:sigma-70 family RNA polymerase sigma factor [FCB group bacterium]
MNEVLVQNARGGDAQAFAKLVEAYYRPIYGLAFSTVGNWQAAEDVAQDAFLVAWLNIAKLRTADAFGAWLRRIARNLAFNWIRSERYRRALLERRGAFEDDETPCEADAKLARADRVAETWTALEKLSPPLREAVVLFYLEENSVAQTATVLGISENAVKKRLQHARPQLRRFFEEQWKADMERERRRINGPEAGRRFMAGVALGPVSTLAGKLGTGAGLWNMLRGALGFDSAVVKPVVVALTVVAVAGAGLFWNAHRQEPVIENAPRVAEAVAPALGAVQVDSVKTDPEPAQKNETSSGGKPVVESGAVAATAAVGEKPVRTVTVKGRIVDEEQNPVAGAIVTVVASDAEISPAEPVAFGGGGAVGWIAAGGGSGGGGAVGGAVSGGGVNGESGGMAGGSFGGVSHFSAMPPPTAPEDPHEDTLYDTLRDETRRFSAKSAADGSFSIANVPGRLLIISADAPGYGLHGTIKSSDSDPIDVTLELSPGYSVEGRLLSAEGQPVADALLQVTMLNWRRENAGGFASGVWSSSPQYWAWRQTDSQGRFTLKLKDPGDATISVRSKALGKTTFMGVPVGPGVAPELRFPRQSSVRGTITRRDGTPAAGMVVLLMGHVDTNNEDKESKVKTVAETFGPTSKATTDAAGAYEITGIDPQLRYTVFLLNDDRTPLVTGLELEPFVAGQPLIWNYTLPLPTVVKGVATGQASGKPVAGVTILCSPLEETPEDGVPLRVPAAQAETKSDGTFGMRITTPPGEYAFGVQTMMGFQTLARREVREGETAVVNLTVPGTWSRNFLVVDASGNPLSGVSVMIQAEGSDWRFGIPEKTGEDGRVRVGHLPSGERLKCIFDYEGHQAESEILEGQEGMEFPEETVVIEQKPL